MIAAGKRADMLMADCRCFSSIPAPQSAPGSIAAEDAAVRPAKRELPPRVTFGAPWRHERLLNGRVTYSCRSKTVRSRNYELWEAVEVTARLDRSAYCRRKPPGNSEGGRRAICTASRPRG